MPVRSVETLFLVSVHQLTDNSTLGKRIKLYFLVFTYLLQINQNIIFSIY